MDRDATVYLTHQALIRKEKLFAAYMTTGIWTAPGSDTSPTTKWDAANSNPIREIRAGISAVHGSTGYRPNTIVLGQKVWDLGLADNPDLIARVNSGQTTGPAITVQGTTLSTTPRRRPCAGHGRRGSDLPGRRGRPELRLHRPGRQRCPDRLHRTKPRHHAAERAVHVRVDRASRGECRGWRYLDLPAACASRRSGSRSKSRSISSRLHRAPATSFRTFSQSNAAGGEKWRGLRRAPPFAFLARHEDDLWPTGATSLQSRRRVCRGDRAVVGARRRPDDQAAGALQVRLRRAQMRRQAGA